MLLPEEREGRSGTKQVGRFHSDGGEAAEALVPLLPPAQAAGMVPLPPIIGRIRVRSVQGVVFGEVGGSAGGRTILAMAGKTRKLQLDVDKGSVNPCSANEAPASS